MGIPPVLRVTSRARLSVAVFVVLISAAAASAFAQTAASPWRAADVGAPALGGSAANTCKGSGCSISVTAGGADIWGSSDQFTFLYATLTGDGALVSRVDGLDRTDDWAKAGLMIRESLNAGGKNAFALVSAAGSVALQSRVATDGPTTVAIAPQPGPPPVWLKLERIGATFTAYRSTDGATWVKVASATLDVPVTVYAGLAVTSHNAALRTTARFSSLAVTTLLPAGWQTTDVGGGLTGGTVSSSGTFYVQAAGRDVSGLSDQFRFTYRLARGDVDVIARVAMLNAVDGSSKAGIMIRASADPAAAHASIFVSGGRRVTFQRRTTASGDSLQTDVGSGGAPLWLKLERRGSTVNAFSSADGGSWTFLGTDTIAFGQDLDVGLAVTSHMADQFALAVFDHVTIVDAPAANVPPFVSLTTPATATTVSVGAIVPLGATASDPDGSVVAVDFLANGILITSDPSSPYSGTWTPAAAGSYAVTAVARDNGGGSTVSSAVIVTVQGSGGRILRFTPSPDDAALVDYYQLEIFRADTTSAAAVVVQSLGKPPIVNGDASVDVTAVLATLPSGTYVAVVDAVGFAATSRSEPSPAFIR